MTERICSNCFVLKLFSVFLCVLVYANFVYGGPIVSIRAPAGPFQIPYEEQYNWGDCFGDDGINEIGYRRDQYHMQRNEDFAKYHIGEDWNGVCGGDTDEGAPLRAIASGKVSYIDTIDNSGKGKQIYIRYSFPYALAPNGVQTFDSAYLHVSSIASDISWSGPGTGSNVAPGKTVAYVGGTGGWISHLHWEAQWDDDKSLVTANSYQNPLTVKHALKYRAPSLMVDDRRDIRGYSFQTDGYWHVFTMRGYAPSSTMYISRGGQRKSLKNAIAAGWIPFQGVLHESDGRWYYYADVDSNFFENGKRYAVKALISGVSHFIPVPRNGFQQDRARLDMLHAIENDGGYASVKTEIYSHDPNWDPDWELHRLGFKLTDGRTAYVYQATHKTIPLARYVYFYNTATKQYSGWVWVGWNRLY